MSAHLLWSDFLAMSIGALPDKVEWVQENDGFFFGPRRVICTRELTPGESAIVAYFSKAILTLEERVKKLEALRK